MPLPLKPSIITKGFSKNEWSKNTGIIKSIISLKLNDILIFLSQLEQILTLPDLLNDFEKKPNFCSQCGHFINSP